MSTPEQVQQHEDVESIPTSNLPESAKCTSSGSVNLESAVLTPRLAVVKAQRLQSHCIDAVYAVSTSLQISDLTLETTSRQYMFSNLRQHVFTTIKKRLTESKISIYDDDERSFSWCLPKNRANRDSWLTLLQNPLLVPTHQLSELLTLIDITGGDSESTYSHVQYYIRTFAIDVDDLLVVITAMEDSGYHDETLDEWKNAVEGRARDSAVFIRYCHCSSRSGWTLHMEDLQIVKAGFLGRFLLTLQNRFPEYIEAATVHEIPDAAALSTIDPDWRDYREHVLISLFNPKFVLNSASSGKEEALIHPVGATVDREHVNSLGAASLQGHRVTINGVLVENHIRALLSLQWHGSSGQICDIKDFYLPPQTLTKNINDTRTIHFAEDGITIRNSHGQSLGVPDGSTATVPLVHLTALPETNQLGKEFCLLWERETDLNFEQSVFSRDDLAIRKANMVLPQSYYKGRSDSIDISTVVTIYHRVIDLQRLLPFQPGDAHWLFARFLIESYPDDIFVIYAGNPREDAAWSWPETVWSKLERWLKSPKYLYHPHRVYALALASNMYGRQVRKVSLCYLEALIRLMWKNVKQVDTKNVLGVYRNQVVWEVMGGIRADLFSARSEPALVFDAGQREDDENIEGEQDDAEDGEDDTSGFTGHNARPRPEEAVPELQTMGDGVEVGDEGVRDERAEFDAIWERAKAQAKAQDEVFRTEFEKEKALLTYVSGGELLQAAFPRSYDQM